MELGPSASSPDKRGKGSGAMLLNVRRIGQRGGGDYESLSILDGQNPGDPARSLEGWTIFVTGLPPETSEEHIRDLFFPFGTIKNVKLNRDSKECLCVGHALIEFEELEMCRAAAEQLNGKPFLSNASPGLRIAPAFTVPALSMAVEAQQTAHHGLRGDGEQRVVRGRDEQEEDSAAPTTAAMSAPAHSEAKDLSGGGGAAVPHLIRRTEEE